MLRNYGRQVQDLKGLPRTAPPSSSVLAYNTNNTTASHAYNILKTNVNVPVALAWIFLKSEQPSSA